MRLMRAALSYNAQICVEVERFVILQGLDYPIRSNWEIDQFFEENPTKEFILAQNISDSVDKKQIFKYRLYWFLDSRSPFANVLRGLTARIFLKTGWIPHLKRNYTVDNQGQRLKIYQGCAQFAIMTALAQYIVRFYDENPRVNRYFRTSYAPDESYFHTVVYNSPFVKNTPNGRAVTKPYLSDFENLTYFEYPVTVTLFKEKKDWPKLRDSGFLYFHKASSDSRELLDYIDQIHDRKA